MIISQDFSVRFRYDIHFTRNLFQSSNLLLPQVLQGGAQPSKVVVVLDQGLIDVRPSLIQEIEKYFSFHKHINLLSEPLPVAGGEEAKNDRNAYESILQLIDRARVDRHAYLMAIGGGAVLDLAGFAAATSHRGIRHIRIPTTVLSQNDSGVGVKNGINYFSKKNFLGAFAPPYAVINDFGFLSTLSDRDWRAGTAEAVKVAAIKDRIFFEWLEQHANAIHQRQSKPMEELIFRCAQLHADHIIGHNDPFEMGSSRPLDFGHWAAHKLEQLTDYELKHGEAVAIGIGLDVQYASAAGYLDKESCDRICHTLEAFGFTLFHPQLIDITEHKINAKLLDGLQEFREHLGGKLTIPMLNAIGEKFDVHEMDQVLIQDAAFALYDRQKTYAN